MKHIFDVLTSALKGLGAIGVLLAVIAFFAYLLLFPLLVVWALNTLFALSIAYSLHNWAAAFVLISIFNTSIGKK